MTKDEQWLLEEKYGGEKSAEFFADCERLASGEPLGYVIGFVPFLNCKIWLDERPLIPRPETEWWVEKAILEVRQVLGLEKPAGQALEQPRSDTTRSEDLAAKTPVRPASILRILDLCAGSGCIGVAVAKAVPEARVDFGEIDARFLPTILKNLAENGIDSARSNLIKSDLFTSITDRYDFILTNPPYIDPALDRTEASVKQYEPHRALYGGRDGLELIEHIIAAAPPHLTDSGQLWLEHEPEHVRALATLARQHNFSVETHTDHYGVPRYSVFRMAK